MMTNQDKQNTKNNNKNTMKTKKTPKTLCDKIIHWILCFEFLVDYLFIYLYYFYYSAIDNENYFTQTIALHC